MKSYQVYSRPEGSRAIWEVVSSSSGRNPKHSLERLPGIKTAVNVGGTHRFTCTDHNGNKLDCIVVEVAPKPK